VKNSVVDRLKFLSVSPEKSSPKNIYWLLFSSQNRNERFEEGVDLPKHPDEGVCDIAAKEGGPDSESTIRKNEKVEVSNMHDC
jgi:hypothetical protein